MDKGQMHPKSPRDETEIEINGVYIDRNSIVDILTEDEKEDADDTECSPSVEENMDELSSKENDKLENRDETDLETWNTKGDIGDREAENIKIETKIVSPGTIVQENDTKDLDDKPVVDKEIPKKSSNRERFQATFSRSRSDNHVTSDSESEMLRSFRRRHRRIGKKKKKRRINAEIRREERAKSSNTDESFKNETFNDSIPMPESIKRKSSKKKKDKSTKKKKEKENKSKYGSLSIEQRKELYEDYVIKYTKLSKANPEITIKIPEFGDGLDRMIGRYNHYLKLLNTNGKAPTLYKYLLTAGWLVFEIVCGKLGLKIDGFTVMQLGVIDEYEYLLIQLGENPYQDLAEEWSPIIRLTLLTLMNGVVMLILSNLSGIVSKDMAKQIQRTLSCAITGRETGGSDGGGTSGLAGIVNMITSMMGGGNSVEAKGPKDRTDEDIISGPKHTS